MVQQSLTYSPTLDIHKEYTEAYDRSMEHWPVPYEAKYVPTSYGQTHVIISGPQEAEPLLLIHGAMYSSTMWYPNIAAFSKSYRTYAIDIIDGKNKSMLEHPPENREAYALWLKEVMTHLGIENARMAGISYGAQLIVNLAIFAPEHIKKAVLMSPAETFVPFRHSFYKYAYGVVTHPAGPEYFHQWIFADRYKAPDFIEHQFRAGVHRKDAMPSATEKTRVLPYVCTDEELRGIRLPVLVLFGEYEVMYDPKEALARAVGLLPQVEAEIVEDAGHMLTMEKTEYVNQRVLAFLQD